MKAVIMAGGSVMSVFLMSAGLWHRQWNMVRFSAFMAVVSGLCAVMAYGFRDGHCNVYQPGFIDRRQ